MSSVSFVRIQRNTIDAIKQAILESLDIISYSFKKDIRDVVIKPNLCYYWDSSTGQTTDPNFIGALIDVIHGFSSNTNISIVESDASAMKCKHVFKFLGYEKLAQDHNVKLVNLSEDKSDPLDVTAGGQLFHFRVPQTIRRADLKINVTKIKYSFDKIKITCALKNIYGCNPYPRKFRYHPKLDEAIVATNKAMKFDLCLVDGNIVFGSQARRIGLVMASKDPVAIDTAAANIAGVNPNAIKYLTIARKEGLGNTQFIPKGLPIEYFKSRYPRKNSQKKLMSKAYDLVSLLKLGKRLGLE
jgi:uncharacterized protein (DUF362 family)